MSRLCRISLLCPSIMWSPESTTRSGWNSSRLDTNTSSMFRAPLDRSWEKMKRLAAGALTRPHCSPGVEQTGPSVCEVVYSWARSQIQWAPSAARKAMELFEPLHEGYPEFHWHVVKSVFSGSILVFMELQNDTPQAVHQS